MQNQAMARKLADRDATDLSECAREGQYYVVPNFIDDMDYCDAKIEEWIWSIGRRKSDGTILASLKPDLYRNPEFDCIWLR